MQDSILTGLELREGMVEEGAMNKKSESVVKT
jgi:hypothetical protein